MPAGAIPAVPTLPAPCAWPVAAPFASPPAAPAASTAAAPFASAAAAAPPSGVTMLAKAEEYKKPAQEVLDKDFSRRRFTWPLQHTSSVDMTDLVMYISGAAKTPGTANAYIRGVKYLFSLFDYGGRVFRAIDAFKLLYRERLIHHAFSKDILDPSITWTRCVVEALC